MRGWTGWQRRPPQVKPIPLRVPSPCAKDPDAFHCADCEFAIAETCEGTWDDSAREFASGMYWAALNERNEALAQRQPFVRAALLAAHQAMVPLSLGTLLDRVGGEQVRAQTAAMLLTREPAFRRNENGTWSAVRREPVNVPIELPARPALSAGFIAGDEFHRTRVRASDMAPERMRKLLVRREGLALACKLEDHGWTVAEIELAASDAVSAVRHAGASLEAILGWLAGKAFDWYETVIDSIQSDFTRSLRDAVETLDARNAGATALHLLSLGTVFTDDSERAASLESRLEQATAALVAENRGLVVTTARRVGVASGLEFLDRVQEGLLGLLKAIERFDILRSNTFSTYATPWIRQAIGRTVADQSRIIRIPVYVQDELSTAERDGEDKAHAPRLAELRQLSQRTALVGLPWIQGLSQEEPSSVESLAVDIDLASRLREALKDLSSRERRVIELRFGLDGRGARTLEHTGREFGVTRERARQIEGKALKKLRDSHRSIRLRSFLWDEDLRTPEEKNRGWPPDGYEGSRES